MELSPYLDTLQRELHAAGIRGAGQMGGREEALRRGWDLSRIEQELLTKLDELVAVIGQKQN